VTDVVPLILSKFLTCPFLAKKNEKWMFILHFFHFEGKINIMIDTRCTYAYHHKRTTGYKLLICHILSSLSSTGD